jgi:hypothetical protein
MKRVIGVTLENYDNALAVYVEYEQALYGVSSVCKYRQFRDGERDKAIALWSLIGDYLSDGEIVALDDSSKSLPVIQIVSEVL